MGLFLCPLCDEKLSANHVCDKDRLLEHVQTLTRRAQAAEHQLLLTQNAVRMLLKDVPSMELEEIRVKTEWLRKLWDATESKWYKKETATDFHVKWMAVHRVLSEAFNVFKSKKSKTLLEKLTELKKFCEEAKIVLGYQDSKFDMSPEQLTIGKNVV